MTQDTKNKFAAILAAQQAKVNNIKPIAVIPVKVVEVKQQVECSNITVNDLLNEPVKSKLTLVDYSLKSFAIIGETYPIKEQLKQLGGKFNYSLTCGAGWIFPKTKSYTVRRALNLIL